MLVQLIDPCDFAFEAWVTPEGYSVEWRNPPDGTWRVAIAIPRKHLNYVYLRRLWGDRKRPDEIVRIRDQDKIARQVRASAGTVIEWCLPASDTTPWTQLRNQSVLASLDIALYQQYHDRPPRFRHDESQVEQPRRRRIDVEPAPQLAHVGPLIMSATPPPQLDLAAFRRLMESAQNQAQDEANENRELSQRLHGQLETIRTMHREVEAKEDHEIRQVLRRVSNTDGDMQPVRQGSAECHRMRRVSGYGDVSRIREPPRCSRVLFPLITLPPSVVPPNQAPQLIRQHARRAIRDEVQSDDEIHDLVETQPERFIYSQMSAATVDEIFQRQRDAVQHTSS